MSLFLKEGLGRGWVGGVLLHAYLFTVVTYTIVPNGQAVLIKDLILQGS